MQMLYVCVLCASGGSSQCFVLDDLKFVKTGRRLISETEAPLLISDKTSADQGPQTTQSTATLVPGMCDSKSGPAKSSDKLRSQSITSKSHRTSGTRLIREMFKQDSKRKSNFSNT